MNEYLKWKMEAKGESIKSAVSGKSVDTGLLRHFICNVQRPEQVSEADFLAVMEAVVNAVQMLPEADHYGEWIPTEDHKPGPYETVIVSVATKNGYDEPISLETLATFESHTDVWENGLDGLPVTVRDYERVTHWMPMPEPPLMKIGDRK